MLEENRKLFEELADSRLDFDWRHFDKSELCRRYLQHENDDLSGAYMSAIIYRYWTNITNKYNMSKSVATFEDCYEWLIDSIEYAFKFRAWEDPTKPIYNDPKGPDKVINKILECRRVNTYVAANRYKRKLNANVCSIDSLQEDYKDAYTPNITTSNEQQFNLFYKELVKHSFDKKDYFIGFVVDGIVNGDCFYIDAETKQQKFSCKRLVKHIRHIDDEYCGIFSDTYEIPKETVKLGISYFENLSNDKLKTKIKLTLELLKRNSFFKDYR